MHKTTGVIELLLAIVTGSVGLLGDAIHNLSDVSTSVVVFLGFRLSRRSPTERYPYGLERAEDLAGVGIAVVIWASAAFAGYESIRKLIEHGHTTHVGAGVAGAVAGIIGNQVVARYKLVIGKRIGSATLIADARHSWLDALSSAGALVGLIAVALGQPWGDPVAGLAITASPAPKPRSRCLIGPTAASSAPITPSRSHSSLTAASPAFGVKPPIRRADPRLLTPHAASTYAAHQIGVLSAGLVITWQRSSSQARAAPIGIYRAVSPSYSRNRDHGQREGTLRKDRPKPRVVPPRAGKHARHRVAV
jgi:Cation efflux family